MEDGHIFRRLLADPSRYGSKIRCGVCRALFLLLWTLPLDAGLAYAYRLYVGTDNMDVFTLLQSVQEFGGGDVVTGVHYILLIAALLILIVIIGIAFHSGARHTRALGNIRLINGHHGKLVLGWFCSLITMLPLIAALAYVIMRYIPALNDPNGLVAGNSRTRSCRWWTRLSGLTGNTGTPSSRRTRCATSAK